MSIISLVSNIDHFSERASREVDLSRSSNMRIARVKPMPEMNI